MAWFEKYPELLQKEEEALVQGGYEYEIDKVAQSEGYLIININYSNHAMGNNEIHILKCVYPASYPYFSVEIFGSTLPPGRHINPNDHRLCLYENEQSEWNPSSDCLAKALDEQLPILLERHKNSEKESIDEEQTGYQLTGQLSYEQGSIIYVDDVIIPDSAFYGTMTLRLNETRNSNPPLVGFVESIRHGSDSVAMVEGPLSEILTKSRAARWVKLNTLPGTVSPQIILNEIIKVWPEIKTPNYGKIGADIVGVLIKEESEYRVPIYNWFFLIRRRPPKKNQPITLSLVRSDRFTKENIFKRVPKLTALSGKHVTVIGVGAIGSHIIWQLVRSGIRSITLIDGDFVQAGNLPRWLIGFSAIGYNKVDVMAGYLLQNFPSLKCKHFNIRVGVGQILNVDNVQINAHDFLCKLINESDLVIDAAAETNVSLYLSNICEESKIPYVWATGTQGAWGGIVGRVIPEITKGNWTSFSYKYAEGEILPPPEEVGSNIQPVGCFSPTFTGTGFDMDQVSLMATRISVALLCDSKDGYPGFDWDVGVLHLWDENTGLPIAPKWDVYKLDE
ncbi:MAG: ThiF family adenylyltransferase [Gammaproteobacteria bacterium]|nr:ThiF family adenylyltransferase [Gammaproteobacteria bacterium]